MSCCKRWNNMLQSQKNIYMNTIYIYDGIIPYSLLKKIYGDTERLVLKLKFKTRCFDSQWIIKFISEFKKIKELVLIAWIELKHDDIFTLIKSSVSLHSLQIIGGQNKMTTFYMDRQNEDSLLLDTIKIGYSNALDPSKSYPHLSTLHCNNKFWEFDFNLYSWFRGELYINPYALHKFSHLKWFDLCHIHIVDNYRNHYQLIYLNENKSVVSYTNRNYFSDEGFEFNNDYLNRLFHIYTHCKIFKISNFEKDSIIYFNTKECKNVDLISIHSKYSLQVSNFNNENNVWTKKYQFQAQNIIFHEEIDRDKFVVEKKIIKNNKLVFLQIQRIII